MKKVIEIEGMSCGHCKARVENVLSGLDGVESVIVNLENKTASLNLSNDISDETIKKVIEDAGYEIIEIR